MSLLAIAAVLYNDLLSPPRHLTPKHIAALKIYSPYKDESLSSIENSVQTIKSETAFLIRQARRFDARRIIIMSHVTELELVEEEKISLGSQLLFEDVDLLDFGDSIRAWTFMQAMESAGESYQRQFLLDGWAAFDELPVEMKRWAELRGSDGGDQELIDDGQNEWEKL